MLRQTLPRLSKPVSHTSRSTGHPNAGGFGKRYERISTRTFQNQGLGMGTYSAPKDRRWPTPAFAEAPPFEKPENMPQSNTTKTLSPEWRPYALADGGVLFTHPTRDQVMQWNFEATTKENEAVGMTTRDHATKAKIQALIADNTLEHTTLAAWRRQQLQRLIRKHAQIDIRSR
jgi:hypothetical protein